MYKLILLEIDLQRESQIKSWVFLPENVILSKYIGAMLPNYGEMRYFLSQPGYLEVRELNSSMLQSYQKIICANSQPQAVFNKQDDEWNEHKNWKIVFYDVPPVTKVFSSVSTALFCDAESSGEEISKKARIYNDFKVAVSYWSDREQPLLYVLASHHAAESSLFLQPGDLPGWADFFSRIKMRNRYEFMFADPGSNSLFLATKKQIDRYNEKFPSKGQKSIAIEGDFEICSLDSSGNGPAALLRKTTKHNVQKIVEYDSDMKIIGEKELDQDFEWTEMLYVDGRYILKSKSDEIRFHPPYSGHDGNYMVVKTSAGEDSKFILLQGQKKILEWHPGNILAYTYSATEKKVIALNKDMEIKIWRFNPRLF